MILYPEPGVLAAIVSTCITLVYSSRSRYGRWGTVGKYNIILTGAHTPLVIVQRSVALVPTGLRYTTGRTEAVVIVAVPVTTVHRPLPVTATLPARVKLLILH